MLKLNSTVFPIGVHLIPPILLPAQAPNLIVIFDVSFGPILHIYSASKFCQLCIQNRPRIRALVPLVRSPVICRLGCLKKLLLVSLLSLITYSVYESLSV